MSLILIVFTLLYCLLLLSFLYGMQRLPQPMDAAPQGISVIVAARNEEQHLPGLLDALCSQEYPQEKHEIIVADDRSDDATARICADYAKRYPQLRWVQLTEENPDFVGKKGALTAAINQARFDVFAFTDADCLPGSQWLAEINRHMLPTVDFVAGYSPLVVAQPWLAELKNLERAAIFACTAGSFGLHWGITCTARNMAYRRKVYDAVDGLSRIGHIRSGDDDLMLQQAAPHCRDFNFIYSAAGTVPSIDKADLAAQAQLEQRRGSKLRHYAPAIQAISVGAAIFYALLIGSFVAALVGAFSWQIWLGCLLAKVLSEALLVGNFCRRVGQSTLMRAFPLAEMLYIPYYLYFGIKGTFGTYRWKN